MLIFIFQVIQRVHWIGSCLEIYLQSYFQDIATKALKNKEDVGSGMRNLNFNYISTKKTLDKCTPTHPFSKYLLWVRLILRQQKGFLLTN